MAEMGETASVRVVRKSDADIKMRDLYVRIDDGAQHNMKYGAEIALDVPPGHHTIIATNRVYTRRLEFDLADKPIAFEVANTVRGCAGAFFALGFGPYACELRRLDD